MRRDMRLIRSINDENVGPDDDREDAIRDRCIEAGYDPEKQYPVDEEDDELAYLRRLHRAGMEGADLVPAYLESGR